MPKGGIREPSCDWSLTIADESQRSAVSTFIASLLIAQPPSDSNRRSIRSARRPGQPEAAPEPDPHRQPAVLDHVFDVSHDVAGENREEFYMYNYSSPAPVRPDLMAKHTRRNCVSPAV